jgi:hypothetical protein
MNDYWRNPCDPNSRHKVMSHTHPYWDAFDAIARRAGHNKLLRIRCGHRSNRSHAVRVVAAWDKQTDEMVAEWKRRNADLLRPPSALVAGDE